jgi:hypothetical protein
MKDACSGEFPQDADSLLTVLRDSLDELNEVKKEISKISNVGSRVAAGVFNQGIEDLRHLVCNSPTAKPIWSTLELCKLLLSHLFGDEDARIEKALEAAKYRSHQAAPFRGAFLLPLLRFPGGARQEEEALQEAREKIYVPSPSAAGRKEGPDFGNLERQVRRRARIGKLGKTRVERGENQYLC